MEDLPESMKKVPDKLLRARRELDAIKRVVILEDWQNDKTIWFIKIRIEVEMPNEEVPKLTDWYAVVDSVYPYGDVKIYPATPNGVTATFPHQNNNARIDAYGLWRKGSLCTEVMGRLFEAEEYRNEYRLAFHVRRAVAWLHAATTGELSKPGDFFESPAFPSVYNYLFTFSEDEVSYMQWEDASTDYGVAYGSFLNSSPYVFCVRTFRRCSGEMVHHVDWGNIIEDTNGNCLTMIWVKLSKVPVINVWQAPDDYGQLIAACEQQGIDLMEIIRRCAGKIRDQQRHFLLLGYPISRRIGEKSVSLFWQALYLPAFQSKKHPPRGFRANGNRWLYESNQLLYAERKIDWITSENWSDQEITQRGKIDDSLLRRNYIIIGCGCVGSSIAEILLRDGVRRLTVIDGDIVAIGNLSRHILLTDDIGKNKACAVKEHLNKISPHARVEAIEKKLCLNENGELNVDLQPFDMIIDCTGSDVILHALPHGRYRKNRLFFSVSIGIEANHVYMNMQEAEDLQFSFFLEGIADYMQAEQVIAESMTLPRDGIGCWHPTFPARSDDIWIAASLAVKTIENYLKISPKRNTSLIYEKVNEGCGYRIVRELTHG